MGRSLTPTQRLTLRLLLKRGPMTTGSLMDHVSIRVLTSLEAMMARGLVGFDYATTNLEILWWLTGKGRGLACHREDAMIAQRSAARLVGLAHV